MTGWGMLFCSHYFILIIFHIRKGMVSLLSQMSNSWIFLYPLPFF